MESNNKRIVRNTLFLYVRQFVIMLLSFFTTRIVLEKLGASDYGINNLVSGFVSMFTLLNSILQTGTRRFLALNLGKGNPELLQRTFSTSFVIHLLVGGVVVFLLETFGLWFLNGRLNIDPSRMGAANWVFQFSVVNVLLAVTQTPYASAMTAHEKFDYYAVVSIFDVLAKIGVLFLLVYIPGDKLIIYSALLLCVSIINVAMYRIYCIIHFEECRFSLKVDKMLFRQMVHFSGWSVIGNFFQTLNTQGLSILLNLFFNTLVNAARGLAGTVNFTISTFINGFIIASEPQLIKSYGAGDRRRFESLIFNVSQYTLFLLAFFAVPVFMEIDFVLRLWLTEVPAHTASFIKITLISSLVVGSYTMVDKAIMASGHIKQLALFCNSIPIIGLPLCYLVLRLGCSPETTYWVGIVPQLLGMFVVLWVLHRYEHFPSRRFFIQIFLKNMFLIALACIPPYLLRSAMDEGWLRFLAVCSLSVVSTMTVMYAFALNAEMKDMLKEQIRKRIRRQ